MIDAKKMLKLFVKEFNTEGHTHVTEDFVIELFNECGINDTEIAKHLFRLVIYIYIYISINIYSYYIHTQKYIYIYIYYICS